MVDVLGISELSNVESKRTNSGPVLVYCDETCVSYDNCFFKLFSNGICPLTI